jgi:hypothetical protein
LWARQKQKAIAVVLLKQSVEKGFSVEPLPKPATYWFDAPRELAEVNVARPTDCCCDTLAIMPLEIAADPGK